MINENDIRALIRELIKQMIEEMSVTGDVAGYNTPHAFGDKRKKDSGKISGGWTHAKKSHKNTFNWNKTDPDKDEEERRDPLEEATYRVLRRDAKSNPKKAVNLGIKKVNGDLFRIERIIDQQIKLKRESGIDSKAYWGTTKSSVNRMYERMQRIAQKIRKLGEF